MSMPTFLLAFVLAVLGIVVILRLFVRKDYLTYGRLRPRTVFLEYLMVLIWVGFGWLNIPPSWPEIQVGLVGRVVGCTCMVAGLLFFGASFVSLGVGRSHGAHGGSIRQAGPYRISRNPQILGFGTFMVGFTVLWPTWQMMGTLILLAVLSHLMVLTEEEFLQHKEGAEYQAYRRRVPRYLGPGGRE